MKALRVLPVLLWLALVPNPAEAQLSSAALSAFDGAAGDNFSRAIDMSGSTIVVGAPGDQDKGEDSGSVYLYEFFLGSWFFTAKLTAPLGDAFDRFGRSVAIDGDLLAVGAPTDSTQSVGGGVVYVFRRISGTWFFEVRLLPSAPGLRANFGQAVAVDEATNTVAVGAPFKDSPGEEDSGSVFVFRRTGSVWQEETRLQASDDREDDQFGFSVDIEGNRLMAGAPGDDLTFIGTISGAVYYFERSGSVWIERQKLKPSPSGSNDFFAWDLDLDGRRLIVSAEGQSAAFVFRRQGSTWIQEDRLTGPTADFGSSVALADPYAIVGPMVFETGSGAAHIFVRAGSSWRRETTLTLTNGVAGDAFGSPLAADGLRFAIGAEGIAQNQGQAFVVQRSRTVFADGFGTGSLAGWSRRSP